jgi:hypothetical protein
MRLLWRLGWVVAEYAFGGNLEPVPVNMFSCLIYLMKTFCNFNAICEGSAPINSIAVQSKIGYSRYG